MESFDIEGDVFVHSERWSAVSEAPVRADQEVTVTGLDGLVLKVRPLHTAREEQEDV